MTFRIEKRNSCETVTGFGPIKLVVRGSTLQRASSPDNDIMTGDMIWQGLGHFQPNSGWIVPKDGKVTTIIVQAASDLFGGPTHGQTPADLDIKLRLNGVLLPTVYKLVAGVVNKILLPITPNLIVSKGDKLAVEAASNCDLGVAEFSFTAISLYIHLN